VLKQPLLISLNQAKNLIYDLARCSDHPYLIHLRHLSNTAIEYWFKQNGVSWKKLVEEVRFLSKNVPFVENLIGYEIALEGAVDNVKCAIYHYGYQVAELSGAGKLNVFDYHAKYLKAFEARETTVKRSDYSDLLNCVTHGIASVESYVTAKANLCNQRAGRLLFSVDEVSNLDDKLNNWLFDMTGYRMNQSGVIWNHFTDLKDLNNKKFKHTSQGAQANSYDVMAKIINKFRTGIARMLFELHKLFKEPVPSKIIRGIYLPEVSVGK
jgi:hypothetical protein